MTNSYWPLGWIAGIAVTGFFAWLTISSGVPKSYAPFNLIVWGSVGLFCNVLDILMPRNEGYEKMGKAMGIMLVPIVFAVWSLPLLWGRVVPSRSIVLLICTAVISSLWLIFGFRKGIHHQGFSYVTSVIVIGIGWWVLLGMLAFIAWRWPSMGRNYLLQVVLFIWLAWYAFPYLGEFQ